MKDGTVPSYLYNFKIHFMKVKIQRKLFSCPVSTLQSQFGIGVVSVWYRGSIDVVGRLGNTWVKIGTIYRFLTGHT